MLPTIVLMEPIRHHLDLRAPLGRVAETGAAFVTDALDPSFRDRLCRAVKRLPFEPVPQEVGPVRQETETCDVPAGAIPEVEALRRALRRIVREHGEGIRGLATWRPTEASVQRYRSRSLGISPHLDGRRYRRLVAVCTLEGSARFSIHGSRGGPPVEMWEAGPGSLVLLRGPGLAGQRDGRPFHRVEGPEEGRRTSIGFRMALS